MTVLRREMETRHASLVLQYEKLAGALAKQLLDDSQPPCAGSLVQARVADLVTAEQGILSACLDELLNYGHAPTRHTGVQAGVAIARAHLQQLATARGNKLSCRQHASSLGADVQTGHAVFGHASGEAQALCAGECAAAGIQQNLDDLETYKAAARALQPHGHVQERLAVAQRAKECQRLFQSLPLELMWLLGPLPAPLRAIEATLHKHAHVSDGAVVDGQLQQCPHGYQLTGARTRAPHERPRDSVHLTVLEIEASQAIQVLEGEVCAQNVALQHDITCFVHAVRVLHCPGAASMRGRLSCSERRRVIRRPARA